MRFKRSSKAKAPDERIESLLDRADAAIDREAFGEALSRADEILGLDARSVEGLHYRAFCLARLERLEEAHEAFAQAVKAAPEDVDLLRGAAEFLVFSCDGERESLEEAVLLLRRALKLAKAQGDADWQAELMLLSGSALERLGESRRALAAFDEARRFAPDDLEIAVERGMALWELCRFDEARKQLEAALRREPRDPWALHTLGLIAEREGDRANAGALFARARAQEPDEFPAPVELSPRAFDKAVEDALGRLPDRVSRYLANVSIAVEDLPAEDDLRAADPPLSPAILGLFHGTPLTERSTSDPWSHFPSAIYLYQKNLQRFARTREELVEQIGITLMHEVGHFLGLSEEDLFERGLD